MASQSLNNFFTAVLLLLMLHGCSVVNQQPAGGSEAAGPEPSRAEVRPEAKVVRPEQVKKPVADVIRDELARQSVAPELKAGSESLQASAKPDSYAIVFSKGSSYQKQIAEQLKQRFGSRAELYFLGVEPIQQAQIIRRIQVSSHSKVVSIGSTAAELSKRLKGKQVVFSQVFNYQSEGLLETGFSGVGMVPSADVLFSTWTTISPQLHRVALFTGDGDSQMIAAIRQAGNNYQLQIDHRVVGNDKEMLYAVKQLDADIQGVWLLPDHRVLSRRVIRELMSYSMKNGRQLVVFNRQMLKYGGLIYVTAQVNDICDQIVLQLNSTEQTVRQLTKATIEINWRTVEQLGLDVQR